MQTRFIVFEGIDASGKKTQSGLLSEFLKKHRENVLLLSYPQRDGTIGKMIYDFLEEQNHSLSVSMQFLLFAADFLKDKERIESHLRSGGAVIADRYYTSALAYQCSAGFPLELALEFAEASSMPKPDAVIYLKVGVKTSMDRKIKEKGKLDRFEGDRTRLNSALAAYDNLSRRGVFGRWVALDGEKTEKEVFEDVKRILGL